MVVRLAVIGAGIMGADHAKIVAQELSGATLQVVCDTNGTLAREVADKVGALDFSTDPEATILNPDVDAVIIASPDFTHAPLSTKCIEVGKKVLCEKPLSQSSEECLEVMEKEQSAGTRFIQVGFMRRYDQSILEMKDALESGSIGRPLVMHNFHRNVETPNANFTGEMAITNSAPHEFDVVRFVLGSEITEISAWQPGRSDDLAAPVLMTMKTEDGQIVTVDVNINAAYGYDVRAELVGETGSISTFPFAHTQNNSNLRASTRYDADWRPRYADAYRRQNQDFVSFVKSGEFPKNASDCWDGYCAALIAETGVLALSDGQRTPIGLIGKPEFYQ